MALYTMGVYPQAVYGMEGVGYSPWAIRTLRTMAADSMVCSKEGRCPITAIAIAKRTRVGPICQGPRCSYSGVVQTCFASSHPTTLARAWTSMEEHVLQETAGPK